jgi:cytochrome P450
MAPIANVNIASAEFKADPFPFYAQLRSEAPVYRTMLPDKRNAWLVTRHNDVLTVPKDDRFGKDQCADTALAAGDVQAAIAKHARRGGTQPFAAAWTGAEDRPKDFGGTLVVARIPT